MKWFGRTLSTGCGVALGIILVPVILFVLAVLYVAVTGKPIGP